MFKNEKPKNAFLQKKNQEKAKAAEQLRHREKVVKVQKNIRAFLIRRKILSIFD